MKITILDPLTGKLVTIQVDRPGPHRTFATLKSEPPAGSRPVGGVEHAQERLLAPKLYSAICVILIGVAARALDAEREGALGVVAGVVSGLLDQLAVIEMKYAVAVAHRSALC